MAATSKAVTQQIKIPPGYICSITNEIMSDPVFAADGHTYEREAMEKWLETNDTSPKTNLKLTHKGLVPNHDKRGDILGFLEQHPELYEEEVYLPKNWVSGLVTAIKANKIKEVNEYLARDRRLLTLKLEGEYTAFYLACQFGSTELANTLLTSLSKRGALDEIAKPPAGFKPVYLNGVLEKSLIEADKAKFSLLLKLGADLHQVEEVTQNTLLHKVVLQGKLEAVEWLLEKRLATEERNVEGNTPLSLAVLHGRVEMVELLLKNGANPKVRNNQAQSAVTIALSKQDTAMLKLLVGTERADLPPLHLALELNDIEGLKTLLKRDNIKASLEGRDAMGRTPFYALLDIKEMKEKEEAVKLLLAAGADTTVACGTGKLTALHLAASQGDLGTLKLLLTTKAVDFIDAEDNQGNTPLHLAAQAGKEEIVAYLLEVGADHEVRNHKGQTPTELAKDQNKANTATFITQKVRALKRAQIEEIRSLRSRIEQLETEVAKLKQIPGLEEDTKKRSEREASPAPLTPQFQAQLKSTQSKPDLKTSAEEVQRFLNHVAAGEQNEAEAMLKQNRDLALASGTVTDHTKKTFKNITGFQYAVWALDWQMWKMIRKYLSEEAAQEQSTGFAEGSWVKQYGEQVEWKKLTEAQQVLIDNWKPWSWEEINEYWVQQIGGLQRLLPMHVLQEYNQPGKQFYPCPKFKEEYILNRGFGKFEREQLGKKYGILRSVYDSAVATDDVGTYMMTKKHEGGCKSVEHDAQALASLFETRIQQRAALVAELSKKPGASRPSK